MEFLTSYYRQPEADTSVLLQQCRCAGSEVLFACVCGGAEKGSGEEPEGLTGLLLEWFRGLRLAQAVRAPEEFMDRHRRELERLLRRRAPENTAECAGIFCLGKEFLCFCAGTAEIRIFNRRMGRTQGGRLFPKEEACGDERGKTNGFRILRGSIEPKVVLLFATDSMLRAVTEQALTESLSVEELQTEERVSKHLWELGRAGERAGGRNMAAVLLRSSTDCVPSLTERGSLAAGYKLQEAEWRSSALQKGKQSGNGERYIRQETNRRSTALQKVKQSGSAEEYIRQGAGWRSAGERAELAEHGYRLERLLGQGSSSKVYLVSTAAGTYYACKVSGKLSLLKEEADLLRKLNHPLFPEFREYWQEENGYLVMEYVAGQSLEEHLRRRGGFSVRRTLQLGLELAFGLLYLHEEMGMVYRDVKPANVILGQDGRARLVDLGCAWEMEKTPLIKAGTPGFAAPEQLLGGCLTAACDVYGLGRLLEAAVGERKRGGRSALRRLRRLIVSCTEESREVRLGEMRSVIRVLSRIAEERKERRGSWEEEILRGRLRVRKNIWKSSHKNP